VLLESLYIQNQTNVPYGTFISWLVISEQSNRRAYSNFINSYTFKKSLQHVGVDTVEDSDVLLSSHGRKLLDPIRHEQYLSLVSRLLGGATV
jgi:hypothetical protein